MGARCRISSGMKTKKMSNWRRRISAGRKPVRLPTSRAAARKSSRVSLPVSALKIPAILLESDPLPETAIPNPPAPAREPSSQPGGERSDALPPPESPVVANPPAETPHPESDAVAPVILTPAGEPPLTPREEPVKLAGPVEASAVAVRAEPALRGQLWLTPRDPHSLLASWTLPIGTESRPPGLCLRVSAGGPNEGGTVEQALPADVSHGFVPVGWADTDYTAQIGYYTGPGQWTALAEAVRVRTPADTLSPEASVVTTRAVDLGLPLAATASEEIRAAMAEARPTLVPWPAAEVPAGRSADAARGADPAKNPPARQHHGDAHGGGAFQTNEKDAPVSVGVALNQSVSSPMGGVPHAKAKDYWLVANAELVVYGATEPGSEVTLAGVRIPLRADGSFSCRLALPAGRHELSIRAVSPDGSDSRQVPLEVTRV